MARRLNPGDVISVRIISREIGEPPYSPILKAVFEFTLSDGRVIKTTEEFPNGGIMNENLNQLLSDLKKFAEI